MELILAQGLSGLASAASLFLTAAGLTLVFGVSRIVNFAHGSLYMLGAFGAYSLAGMLMPLTGGLGFWLALPLSALAVALLGALVEVLLLRRIYAAPELLQLLATFALVLIIQDAALALWGAEDRLGPRAPGLSGAVTLLGARIPEWDLFMVAMGPLVLMLLLVVLRRTRWGLLVRAAAEDRQMLMALGHDQRWIFTTVFTLGAGLAGLAGALQLPRQAVSLAMDLNVIAEVFVVVVLGGMGSLTGAFLAAILIGLANAFGILIFPKITLVLIFLIMALVLLVRPQGLLGRPGAGGAPPGERYWRPEPWSARAWLALAVGLALLLAAAMARGAFEQLLLAEVLIFTLFAASLQFQMSQGGLISFGHAAFFGLGAYAAALAAKDLGFPMLVALALAPLAAGLGALAFGAVTKRLSGVYLAMLSLAFAQILWSAAFQWTGFSGGDNGILGVWPSRWASDPTAFLALTLVLVGTAFALLFAATFSSGGTALRACRDSPERARAIGLDPSAWRWAAQVLAGALAGLAGGLYAFLKGSVFPESLSIPTSVEALAIALLGGLHALVGPLVGALVFVGIRAELASETDLWRSLLGALILAVVLFSPEGLARLFRFGSRR